MPSIIENLNSVITTKNELGYILRENGVNPGEVFSDYPTYFRDVISSGGGGSDKVTYSYLEERLSDYPTYSYSNENYVSYAYLNEQEYASETYVVEYVAEHGGGDMSAYVTKTELSAQSYITSADLPDLSTYVTKDELSAQSYLTAVPNTYPTYAAISNMGYVTSSDLPVINENIIPKKTDTYTLGDNSYYYKSTYSSNLVMNTYESGFYIAAGQYGEIKIRIATLDRFNISSGEIYPLRTGSTLGSTAHPFAYTYTYNLVLENDTGLSKSVSSRLDINLNGDNKFYIGSGGFFPVGTKQLGSNGSRFDATYTNNLYSPSLVLSYSYNSIYNASNTQINFKVNGWNRAKLTNTTFCPSTNNGIRLGDLGAQWSSIYAKSLYLDGTPIESIINNLIWTGTAAEYAALDNYTSYQIYMIKEA